MKHLAWLGVTIFVLVCPSLVSDASAEQGVIEVGGKAALSRDRFARDRSGSAADKYELGGSIGGGVRYGFSRRLSGRVEIFYASRGSTLAVDGEDVRSFVLAYVEVPLLARIELGFLGSFQGYAVAGPAMRYLLSATAEDDNGTRDIKPNLRGFDLGATIGVGAAYELTPAWNISLEARYDAGLLDIDTFSSDDSPTRSQSFMLTIGIGYAMNNDPDRDGISNQRDLCPRQREDRDGFEDMDGCPDDNDGDGIADALDQCPGKAEHRNGFEDEDGCPEGDSDGDGIPNGQDRCEQEPFPRNDGCPPRFDRVAVAGTRLDLRPTIEFDNAKVELTGEHRETLDQVAAILVDYYPDMRLRIEGHADGEGSKAKNDELSEQRAKKVYEYLTLEKGIDRDRLEVIGHGERRPLEYEKTEEGKRRNRRVELVILEGL